MTFHYVFPMPFVGMPLAPFQETERTKIAHRDRSAAISLCKGQIAVKIRRKSALFFVARNSLNQFVIARDGNLQIATFTIAMAKIAPFRCAQL